MKRLWCAGLALALLLGTTACAASGQQAQSAAVQETVAPQESSNTLIAYFSLAGIVPEGADAVSQATPSTGNVEAVAAEIQRQVGGTLFAIQTDRQYPVSHRECSVIAQKEMEGNDRPVLTATVQDMDDYDTVYIGYPIWWYQEPMVIRSFLEAYDFTGKTVIPFCVSLAVGIEQSEENIRKLIPGATVLPGLRLQTERNNTADEIGNWLSAIAATEGAG